MRIRELIATIAPTRIAVLIRGETGTGKELVATALHEESGRRGKLVSFNVCAIAETMFEDSLFGHVRGAFTGAANDAQGLLREADGGTAFLDEISGVSSASQAKLLRAIETGVVRPVGGSRDIHADLRIVSATNENLMDLVDARRFRLDLAHRLSGIVIQLPSLRDRAEDIPQLVSHFLKMSSAHEPVFVDPSVHSQLMQREWRGNVRELRQVIESAAILGGNVVDADSVGEALAGRVPRSAPITPQLSPRGRLLVALQHNEWDTRAVAEQLGVHRATIYRQMRRYQLEERTDSR